MRDARAITTSTHSFTETARMIRNYVSKVRYLHDIKGVNVRLNTIQAAVLNVKLPYLDIQNKERKLITEWYKERLENKDNIKIQHIP